MRAIGGLVRGLARGSDAGTRGKDEERKGNGMRAVRFERFGDYGELGLAEVARPEPADGQALIGMRAAAVNPLDDTVRRGYFSMAKEPPLVLGNEGTGVVAEPGGSGLAEGTRVMFGGTYGVLRDGTWQEYVAADARDLVPVPESLGDAEAAGVPEAWLTAQLALRAAGGFEAGRSVLAPAVGGSVGNAAVQLARAQGASRVITSAGSTAKAEKARAMGYEDVVDLSRETLSAGVARLTDGAGVDLAINGVGGALTGEALASLAQGGTMVAVGYSAGTEATVNLLDLIVKTSRVVGFNLFSQPPEAVAQAYGAVLGLISKGRVGPVVARTFPLEEAAEAQRHLIEDRPFGKVVLTM